MTATRETACITKDIKPLITYLKAGRYSQRCISAALLSQVLDPVSAVMVMNN